MKENIEKLEITGEILVEGDALPYLTLDVPLTLNFYIKDTIFEAHFFS